MLNSSDVSQAVFLRLWWAFFWRFVIWSALLSAAVGACFGIADLVAPKWVGMVPYLRNFLLDLALVPSSMLALSGLLRAKSGYALEVVTPDQHFS